MTDDPLDMPVQFVKGVGPARAAQFETLGVRTVGDLLEHLPFRYELKPKSKPIGHLTMDETATVVGAIRKVRTSGGYRRSSEVAEVEDGTGRCRVRWFNSPYLRDMLRIGQVIRLTGKVGTDGRLAVFVNPKYGLVDDDEDPFAADVDAYEPVYRGTSSLANRQIARVVGTAVEMVTAPELLI